MTIELSTGVASRIVPGIAEAIIEGLGVDARSRRAGYDAELAGAARDCPAGVDPFSFYLGRAEARRYSGGSRR